MFQRALCISIDGIRYSAFGNMLLLRQPEKHQVFFHRRTDGKPTEQTEVWTTGRQRLISAATSGDVLVTPGISECEKRIKNMALQQGLRLIHVQSEPIGKYWKPELSRFATMWLFKACDYKADDLPTPTWRPAYSDLMAHQLRPGLAWGNGGQ